MKRKRRKNRDKGWQSKEDIKGKGREGEREGIRRI